MRIDPSTLASTLETLRTCGAGRRECVVFWTGAIDAEGVDAAEHPAHAIGSCGYSVDERWLTTFLIELARSRRTARAQVHTHPHAAFHSRTDDLFPLVHTGGFYSLVIPHFAMNPDPLEGSYLCRRRADGSWERVPVQALDVR